MTSAMFLTAIVPLCLAVAWRFHPPGNTSTRAAWTMLALGAASGIGLRWTQHPAWLVVGLPIVALAPPLALWRRVRGTRDPLATLVAHRRINWALSGSLLFLSAVVLATRGSTEQSLAWCMLAGLMVLGGMAPVHRPATEVIRQTPHELRPVMIMVLGPVMWLTLSGWMTPTMTSPANASALLVAGPVLSMAIGAFLVLARGDLGRLVAAAFLFSAGQVGLTMLLVPTAAGTLNVACLVPVFLVALLLARLEKMTGTAETMELGGLLARTPRFGIALAVVWMSWCGVVALAPLRPLWQAWTISPDGSTTASIRQLWPILVPHVIAVWGVVRFLNDSLFGIPRSPSIPEPLREFMPPAPATQNLVDLTVAECTWLAVLATAGIAAMTSQPKDEFVHRFPGEQVSQVVPALRSWALQQSSSSARTPHWQTGHF